MPSPAKPQSRAEKQLAYARKAVAAARLETLRLLPDDLGFETAAECLQAFCLVHDLPVPTTEMPDFRTAAKHRIKLLHELPTLLQFSGVQELIVALRIAHGENLGRRILTPDKIRRLIELTAQNVPSEDIAKELGCAKQTVANMRYKLGIKQTKYTRPPRPQAQARNRRLVELTAQGASCKECAAKLGCGVQTVVTLRGLLGISHQNKKRRMALAAKQLLSR